MVRPHIYSSTIFVIFLRVLLAIPKGRSEGLTRRTRGPAGKWGGVDAAEIELSHSQSAWREASRSDHKTACDSFPRIDTAALPGKRLPTPQSSRD